MENLRHVVIKCEDLDYCLNLKERIALDEIIKKVERCRAERGRKIGNTYYVCNTDEPYAEEVLNVILKGESAKF